MQLKQILASLIFFVAASSQAEKPEQLVTFPSQDGGQIEAALFPADSNKVVVFAHGAIYNKESWYFLARDFQQRGISALALDFRGYGNSRAGSTSSKYYDILGAINYLHSKGFGQINIVGASMGGAAVLQALSRPTEKINKLVLLAPAGGAPALSTSTAKLFVVSKNEGLYKRVKSIYAASSEPKKLQVFPDNSHAQHLFESQYADELKQQIIEFILTD